MIHTILKSAQDIEEIQGGYQETQEDSFDYGKVIVKKPWGYEYLVFENEHIAIWMLQIVRKHRTSMHCHPNKTTALILLSGQATVRSLDQVIELHALDAVNIDKGAFHSTEASSVLPNIPVSVNGIWIMEIESPPKKKDLFRARDVYGRTGHSYEGESCMVFEPQETVRFQVPSGNGTCSIWKHHDLTFVFSRGAFHPEHYPQPSTLVVVVGMDGGARSRLPNLQICKSMSFQQFLNLTENDTLDGLLLLSIERVNEVKLTDYVANYLSSLGIGHLFAVSGGAAMHLVDSFGGVAGLHYIATHHEQAAAMAAEGYARIAGCPGLVLVTAGPGGTNAITGVYGAWVDSIPMIVLSGQVTQDTLIGNTGLRQYGIQEGNIIEIVKPMTKYAVMVTDPKTIRYHLEKACYLAVSGRPGPVWLDIPLDVQAQIISPSEQEPFIPEEPDIQWQHSLPALVAQSIEWLAQAERPVVVYGYGVRLSGAETQLLEMIQTLGVPTISSWTASDMVPTDTPVYVGRCGIMGDRGGNFAVQNADLLLIIGSRMSVPQTGYNYKVFARAARKIMVDIDAVELHNKPSLVPDLAIQADAGAFLYELLNQSRKSNLSLPIEAWRNRCLEWKEKYPVVLPEYKDNLNFINSFYFIDQLSEKLGNDAIVVTDMGTSFTCTMQTFRTKAGQRLFTSSGFASMGFGLPGAVGACYGGSRKVILISGDGGLQMNIQELQTVYHNKLPIILFVINNLGYLTIKHMQQNHFGRYVGSDPSSGVSCPDLLKLAIAYGIDSVRFNNQEELSLGLDRVLDHPGPFICEIMMSEDQPLIPRTSSMKLPNGSIVSQPIENLYPFLDREEFLSNMIVKPLDVFSKT